MRFVADREVNILGKGENLGYQQYLHFPYCFQKTFYSRGRKKFSLSDKELIYPYIKALNNKNFDISQSKAFKDNI